jgi:diaminohydroxyphosphoribosylaminopyrimidine deaminase/5-amino-6-(5-phosphoribosylamino)uracil reductase
LGVAGFAVPASFVNLSALNYNAGKMVKHLNSDEQFMREALKLARRGLGSTSPNPMVGAVIVKEGRIIARGYHHAVGRDHAEVDALKHAKEDVAGATLYVTLEPCRHYGRTPPCTSAVIEHKIARVVIGMLDPDEKMRGGSVTLLNNNGVATAVGVLEDECRALNEKYIKHRTTGLPYVTMKFAQTLDGRIASASGASRWVVASPETLKIGHKLRAENDAILAGIENVLLDDPELTLRLVKGRSPTRIILDSRLRIPLNAKVLANQETARTLVATTPAAPKEKAAALKAKGIEVVTVPADEAGRVDLKKLLKMLGERQITSLLVEGGGEVYTSFLKLGLVDKITAIIAPKILGRGRDTVRDLQINDINKAIPLVYDKVYRSGEDIVMEIKPKR